MVKKVISYTLVFIILGFLIINISKNWEIIIKFPWRFDSLNLLLLALFLLPAYIVNATSWHLVTKALGFNLSYSKNLKIWLYSNLGRLIPGVIWQYAGRVYLTHKEGIPNGLATAALGAEAVLLSVVGLLTVLATVVFWGLHITKINIALVLLLCCFLVLIIFAFRNENLVNKLIELISRLTNRQIKTEKISLPLKWLPILFCTYLLQFILGGSVLFFLARSTIELSFSSYPLFIGIFAASWLLGYVSIFSPGGLGIQELSLAGLLSAYMPFTIATVVAIIYRFLILAMEIITISIVYLLQKVKIKSS